jgi:hypothetical protein
LLFFLLGGGLGCCFSTRDCDCCCCCQRQQNERNYELEQRGEIEPQEPNASSTENGTPVDHVTANDSEPPASPDQEPNIDSAQTPTVITTQPPSYEEVTQRENV